MFELRLAKLGAEIPIPRSGMPGVQVWEYPDPPHLLLAEVREGSPWIHVVGVASFRIDSAAAVVTTFARPGVGPSSVLEAFQHMVLPVALQASGWEVLHASAVQASGGVVALCADSGIGKSTLAYALDRLGFALRADDLVTLSVSATSVQFVPLSFRPRLRPASASYFGLAGTPGTDGPHRERANPSVQENRLAALCVLRRMRRDPACPPVNITRLTPTRAYPVALARGFCFSLQAGPCSRRMLQAYLELSAQVPVFEISFQEGFDLLPGLVDAVADLLRCV